MRVILELEELVLEKLQTLADKNKRSRKNYMEFMLTNISEGWNVEYGEVKKMDTQQRNININVPNIKEVKISQYDAYKIEIKDSGNKNSLAAIMKIVKQDSDLSNPQKANLEAYALEVSKDFFND